jgi:hypothetical protein
MRIVLLLLLLLFVHIRINAQLSPGEIEDLENDIEEYVQGNLAVDIEQDFFVDWIPGANMDRNYTQGTGFLYTKPGLDNSFLFFPFNILQWLNELKDKRTYILNLPSSIGFGVTAFTPLDIDEPDPVVGDRPFGSVVYLSTIKNRFNTKKSMFNYNIIQLWSIGYERYKYFSIMGP